MEEVSMSDKDLQAKAQDLAQTHIARAVEEHKSAGMVISGADAGECSTDLFRTLSTAFLVAAHNRDQIQSLQSKIKELTAENAALMRARSELSDRIKEMQKDDDEFEESRRDDRAEIDRLKDTRIRLLTALDYYARPETWGMKYRGYTPAGFTSPPVYKFTIPDLMGAPVMMDCGIVARNTIISVTGGGLGYLAKWGIRQGAHLDVEIPFERITRAHPTAPRLDTVPAQAGPGQHIPVTEHRTQIPEPKMSDRIAADMLRAEVCGLRTIIKDFCRNKTVLKIEKLTGPGSDFHDALEVLRQQAERSSADPNAYVGTINQVRNALTKTASWIRKAVWSGSEDRAQVLQDLEHAIIGIQNLTADDRRFDRDALDADKG